MKIQHGSGPMQNVYLFIANQPLKIATKSRFIYLILKLCNSPVVYFLSKDKYLGGISQKKHIWILWFQQHFSTKLAVRIISGVAYFWGK